MRTRHLLLLLVPVALLLALGAVPGMIGGGDVHYVVATEEALEDGVPPGEASETIPAANLSENRFPYVHGAIDEGTVEYEEGRFGFEDYFTHTPFDEFSELQLWNPSAVDGDVVWIEENGSYYRVELTNELDD